MKDQPRKFKYKKNFKMPIKNVKNYINVTKLIKRGFLGLEILENGRITIKQLESLRRVLVRKLNKQGKIWFFIFPQHPVTAKAGEVRMGRGKGKIKHWVCRVKKGNIILEIGSVKKSIALNALKFAKKKLPVKCKIFGPII